VAERAQPTTAPIGVYDSGVGGLSILQALRAELPAQDVVYVADNGHAPYGERDAQVVNARAQRITRYLVEELPCPIQLLVVACNTATALAIDALRAQWPALPIIGVEPALKPAVQLSQTHHVGVWATQGTVRSDRFVALQRGLADQAQFHVQACNGLAAAIEHQHHADIETLCTKYLQALGPLGQQAGQIDTLVLGCTHYPFAADVLRQMLGPHITLVDSGAAVARQTRRRLTQGAPTQHPGQITLCCTGDPQPLAQAAQRWLGLASPIQRLSI